MGFGAFAGGFAKTVDAKAVGGAIRDYNATSNYDERMEKAGKKHDADMLALNNERAGRQAQNDPDTGKGLPNATPLQQTSPGGQAIDSPASGQPADSDWSRAAARPLPDWYVNGKQPVKDGIAQVPEWYDKGALPPKEAAPAAASPQPSNVRISAEQKQAIQPMSDRDYERRSGEIMMAKQQAGLQARRKYYMDMGQADKAMEVDKQIDKMNWHAGMMKKYYDFMDGKAPDVDKAVLGAVNAMMPRGQKYVAGENGTYNLVDAKGNVLQAGLEFTPQQKMAGFQQAYAMADFMRSGDFDAFMGRFEKQQNMGMAIRKQGETETHNQESEQRQREQLEENKWYHRAHLAQMASDRAANRALRREIAAGRNGGKDAGAWIGDTKIDEKTGRAYREVRDKKNGDVLGRQDDESGVFIPSGSSLEAEQGRHAAAANAGMGVVFDRNSRGNVFVDLKTRKVVPLDEVRKRLSGKPTNKAGEPGSNSSNRQPSAEERDRSENAERVWRHRNNVNKNRQMADPAHRAAIAGKTAVAVAEAPGKFLMSTGKGWQKDAEQDQTPPEEKPSK